MKFSPLTIAQAAITSSSQVITSIEVDMMEDVNKFNWFEQWYPAAPEYDLDMRVPLTFTVSWLDIVAWMKKTHSSGFDLIYDIVEDAIRFEP
ncbi:hypothetical protein KI387_009085, partial [Taxus chinensis]